LANEDEMEIQINSVNGKIQVRFREETEFGPYSDALYYTEEQWKTVTESTMQEEARIRVDNWVLQLRKSNLANVQYEIVPAKVLLLFGAGASYGARGISPRAPPLGPDLFDRLRKTFPNTWGKVSGEVADIFKKSPEKGMEALDDDAYCHRSELVWLIRDMAVYFSRFNVKNISTNLYCRFVQTYKDRILGGDILLSTLNYECLIEYALGVYGITPTYIGNVPASAARVLKVHGSCNFIPQNFLLGQGEGLTFNWTWKSAINTSIKFVHPNAVGQELDKTGIPSAMSMYTERKQSPICPLTLARLRSDFIKYCEAAKIVITVGVRPNPDDSHIWNVIADSSAIVFIVADKISSDDWIAKSGKGKATWIGETFAVAWEELRKNIDAAFADSSIPGTRYLFRS
jgi:hypothetical protein